MAKSQILDDIDVAMLRRLVGERDLRRFFEQAADEAARLVGADGAALIEVLESGDLKYRFFRGLPVAHQRMAHGEVFSAVDSTAGVALLEGRPLFTADYPRHPKAMASYVASGLKANLLVPCGPVGHGNAVLAIAWFSHYPVTVPDEHALSLIMLLADLMHAALYRQSLEENLARQADHDVLTGLPNRRFLSAYLEKLFGPLAPPHPGWAVAILDLDDFKPINDRYGHSAGDTVLQEVAARLRVALLPGDVVARLGGDEFVLIIAPTPDASNPLNTGIEGEQPTILDSALVRTMNRICAAIDQPYAIRNGERTTCTGSIGLAINSDASLSSDHLLANADRALYYAKRRKSQKISRWKQFPV